MLYMLDHVAMNIFTFLKWPQTRQVGKLSVQMDKKSIVYLTDSERLDFPDVGENKGGREHTKHTHGAENTHPEQWAANAAAPGEQLGVSCLAQGSHLSRGIDSFQVMSHPYRKAPARSHGNSYTFYEVANSYEFVRPHSYEFRRFLLNRIYLRVGISYEFVRITYT